MKAATLMIFENSFALKDHIYYFKKYINNFFFEIQIIPRYLFVEYKEDFI